VRTAILLPYGIITVVFRVRPSSSRSHRASAASGMRPSPPLDHRYTSLFVIIITEFGKTTRSCRLLLLAGPGDGAE